MRVFITGVTGQLGYDLAKSLEAEGIDYKGVGSADLDITDADAVREMLLAYMPDVVVHCAAYTNVDKAEEEPDKAYAVNVTGTTNLAEVCKEIDAAMMYISTDYVFPGNGNEYYQTESAKTPLNVYGKSKLMGELAVQEILEQYYIVRTSWVIGIHGKNFVKTMLKLSETRDSLNIVDDQIGSPTFTMDLAPLLCSIIKTEKYGVYHATNEGICSWADFAEEIFRLAGRPVTVNRVTSEEYGAKATRPLNSRLSKESLDQGGFPRLPDWKNSLQAYLNEYISAGESV